MNPVRFGILSTQSDGRLVELAAAGHERAFEVLVARYRQALARYCRRILPAGQVDDVVQQTFLHAWSAVRSGSRIGEVRPWLYAIARNQAVSVLRSRRPVEAFDEAEHAPTVEPAVEARATLRTALHELAGMGDDEREALVRTALGGESHEDIARDLGMSGGAVRQMVYRTRASLRAAATAVVPFPLAHWLAAARGRALPLAQRLPELTAGAGATGAVGAAVKSGAVVAAVGALAGATPAVVAHRHHATPARTAAHAISPSAAPLRERPVARAAAAAAPRRATASAHAHAPHARTRAHVAAPHVDEPRPPAVLVAGAPGPVPAAPRPATRHDAPAPVEHAALAPAAPRSPARTETTSSPAPRAPAPAPAAPSAENGPGDDHGSGSGSGSGSDDGAATSGTSGTSGESTSGGGTSGGGQDDAVAGATDDGGRHGGSSGGSGA